MNVNFFKLHSHHTPGFLHNIIYSNNNTSIHILYVSCFLSNLKFAPPTTLFIPTLYVYDDKTFMAANNNFCLATANPFFWLFQIKCQVLTSSRFGGQSLDTNHNICQFLHFYGTIINVHTYGNQYKMDNINQLRQRRCV